MLMTPNPKTVHKTPALRRRGMRLALLGGVSLLPILGNIILPKRAHAATCSGVITGVCSEITIGADGNVTVTGTGAVDGAAAGISNSGYGIGTLSNSGTINGSDDAGIINDASGSIGTLISSGSISGQFVGVYNDTGGSIGTLSNAQGGTIAGSVYYGVFNGAGTIGSMSNEGLITAVTDGIDNNAGLIGTLSNGGSISGTGKYGIIDYTGATIGLLSNEAGGAITGAHDGIHDIGALGTLINSGTIAGLADAGVSDRGSITLLENGINALISGGATGVESYSGGTIGILSNAGTITGGTAVVNTSSIGLLSNDGTLDGADFAGIYNDDGGVIGTLVNGTNATIIGASSGIANAALIGTLINAGTIIGATLTGIDNTGGTIGTLANSGLISGELYGIDNAGSTIGLLENSGRVIGTEASGINNNGGPIGALINSGTISGIDYGVHDVFGTIGLLDNQAGLISGGNSGIDNASTVLTLSNEGTISGGNGIANEGIVGDVSNGGLITGGAQNGLLNDDGAIGSVENRGTIIGEADGISNFGYTTETIRYATIGALTNGGTISGGQDGFYQDVLGAAGTLANTLKLAVIAGGTAGVFNAGAIGLLSNAGTIMTTLTSGHGFEGQAVVGVENEESGTIGTLENLAGGVISGGSTGIYNLGGIGLLSNSGLISGGSSGVDSEGGIGTLTNAGLIAGGSTGIDNEGGSIGVLSNTGTIEGGEAGILNSYNRGQNDLFGTIALLQNAGLIEGGTTGVANAAGSTISALSNTGTISGGAYGIYDAGGIGTLDNAGLIEGGSTGVEAVTGSIGMFENSGTIIGGTVGVALGGGTLVNAGLIEGATGVILTGDNESLFDSGTIASSDGGDAILFQAPDPDSLTLTTGADIIGTIDGGNTAGQITLEGEGTLDDAISGFTAGSALDVAAGASWAGAGSWTIASLTNDGVFQGGLVGTPLTLTGNFVQTPNGTLLVAVTPAGESQFLVDGSVTLAGGLKYEFAPGTYRAGTYKFLSATGGITGGFVTAAYDGTVPAAFTHATLQDLSTGNLVLTANQGGGGGAAVAGIVAPADSALFGDTSQAAAFSAQAATANLLDKAAEGGAAGADAAACAAQAAEVNATGNGPNISGAARMATALGQAFCAAGGWVEANGGVSGVTGAGGYNGNAAGFLAGIDAPVNQLGTRVGLAVGYDEDWLKDRQAGKASIGTARAGVFASQPVGGAVIAADVMYGALSETTTRQTGPGALQAKPDGSVVQGGVQAGTWLPLGGFALAPAAGLRFAIISDGGFAEAAGPALRAFALRAFALRGASSQDTSVQPYLNVTASRSYLTGSGVTVTPDVMLGYAAELGDRGKSVAVTAADGTEFVAASAAPDTSAAELSAGLAARQGNWSLYAKYSADLAGNWTEQTGEAGLQVRF